MASESDGSDTDEEHHLESQVNFYGYEPCVSSPCCQAAAFWDDERWEHAALTQKATQELSDLLIHDEEEVQCGESDGEETTISVSTFTSDLTDLPGKKKKRRKKNHKRIVVNLTSCKYEVGESCRRL